jgi:molybdopterin converting factor small subunit
MIVQVLFFGATAAIAGKRTSAVDVPAGSNTRAVFDKVLAEFPRLGSHKLHFAVNQQYSNGAETLHENDELAVFTSVSGG